MADATTKIGDVLLDFFEKEMKDVIDTDVVVDIADNIEKAVKDGADNVWSKIGKTITENDDISKGLLKTLFDEDSLKLIKDNGLSDDSIIDILGKKLSKADNVVDVKNSIINNLPDEFKKKGIGFINNTDDTIIEELIDANDDKMLGNAIKYGLNDKTIEAIEEKGVTSDIIDQMLKEEYKVSEKGKVYGSTINEKLKSLKNDQYTSANDQAAYRFGMGVKDLENEIQDTESREKLLKKFNLSEDATDNQLYAAIERGRQSRVANPTFGDNALYHKVPQRGMGGVSLAFLVQNMSSKRGQMSNAELYGQAPPY